MSHVTSAPWPPAGPLALLTIPFIFTQDGLLGTNDFLKQAKERGISLSLEGLQKLHKVGLLAPLYRVDDHVVAKLRINTETASGMNACGWTVEAARDGRLRDGAQEGYSEAWPFERPAGPVDDGSRFWWNGYTYSPWQLLDLRHILNEHEIIQAGWRQGPLHHQHSGPQLRQRHACHPRPDTVTGWQEHLRRRKRV